jgi:hypothetical protein
MGISAADSLPADQCSRSAAGGPRAGVERGGGIPGGWILEVVDWQPDLRTFLKVYMELGSYFLFLQEQIKDIIIIISRAGKGAPEGNKPGVGCKGHSVPYNDVVGESETALFVRLVQAHVDPSPVLLVE